MKTYYVKKTNGLMDRVTVFKGTLEYLENEVFSYTLLCGNSWDHTIRRTPKTGSSLVSALNRSANVTRHYSNYYELITKEEYEAIQVEEFENSKTYSRRETKC